MDRRIIIGLGIGMGIGLAVILAIGVFMPSGLGRDDAVVTTYRSLPPQAQSLYFEQSDGLTKPVPERLVELDMLHIGCFGPAQIKALSPSDTNLGGQCCGVLKDFEAYKLQLAVLGEFIAAHGGGELIPADPYDVPVALAQQLIGYDEHIVLTPQQQATYDRALEISHHGPCCCKCWKWYVMSGLGKKLIVDYGYAAQDVAQLWDLSSSCGHAEDTDMHAHYHH